MGGCVRFMEHPFFVAVLVSNLDGLCRDRLKIPLTVSFEFSECLDYLCLASQAFAYNENFFRWIHLIFLFQYLIF